MKTTRISVLALILLLLGSSTFVACDSNDDELDSEATVELSAMFNRLSSALAVAFNPFSVGKSEGSQEIIECPQGGTVDVQGDQTSVSSGGFAFDLSMTFNDCNDLNGTLTYEGDGSFASDFTSITYEVTMNGQLTAECVVNYNNFAQTVTTNVSTQDATISFNGSISATCNSGSLTCSFDGVTLNAANITEDIFRNSCN